MAQIDPVTMDPLAKLLFDLNLDQGRQVLSDWFKKPEHWKIPDPAVAIRLAGLGTYREPFSVLSLEELPLTATGMRVITDGLDPKTLDPALALEAMEVLWKGGQPLRAREWAPIVIDRCCAQISLLPRLARILHQIGFSGPKKSYPQILAATVKAIEGGKLSVNAENDQSLAMVLCDPASRLELERILLGPDSLPRPRVAALLAWATRNAGVFDPWAQRVKSKVTANADATDAKAAWLIAECYVDEQMLRPGMEDPGTEIPGKVSDASIRRFRALKLALTAAQSQSWKDAVLREIAAYFISRYRGKQGADLLANFESQSPAVVAELKQSLLEYDRQRLLNEEREILANKRSGEMVLLERQRRDLVTVSKTGDTAVITRLKNHIQELGRSTRPAMHFVPSPQEKGSTP